MNRASRPTTAILLGAGMRGAKAYAPYALAHPDRLRFVAVAEPNPERRQRFAAAHGIPDENRYDSWEALIARGRIADVCFNATQDQLHYPTTQASLELGYDVLVEKPITNTLKESVALVESAERNGCHLQVCHVLRHTPFFLRLHEIVASGRLGELVTVEHRENVAYWHMAHSFVRGNWRNSQLSSPMILAKCCHDLDVLVWNLPSRVRRLHSHGSLFHFRSENAPEGAPERGRDGCPAAANCPFEAERFYLDMGRTGSQVQAISEDLSLEGRRHALQTGPYGRCVYRCDNDVVDHQIVSMAYENGASAVLVMHGHAGEETRTMRYEGTRASLLGTFEYHRPGTIEIIDHLDGEREEITVPVGSSGHGGGDMGIVESFLEAVKGDRSQAPSARESLESHYLAFAAEASRQGGAVVDMDTFRQEMAGNA
ncbi:MAG: Gfo/Idh/MocA family oxidoreductase [Trueperaceae bacterium]|nr:MAG: Gfo/Idh/MocA family oxidoreductase [Trueperaceae bacterium]